MMNAIPNIMRVNATVVGLYYNSPIISSNKNPTIPAGTVATTIFNHRLIVSCLAFLVLEESNGFNLLKNRTITAKIDLN